MQRKPIHEGSPRAFNQIGKPNIDGDAHSYEEGSSSASEPETNKEEDQPVAPETPATPKIRGRSPRTPRTGESFQRNRSGSRPSVDLTINEENQTPKAWLGVVFVIVIAIISVYFNKSVNKNDKVSRKTCAFEGLRRKLPTQPEIVWRALQNGIEGLVNKEANRPSVFLFLHDDQRQQKLIGDIANEASSCFGGPSQLIHMSKEDFGLENGDYGLAIERFKAKVNKGSKVFLIVNLNELPPNGARALHTICDVYSPLVEDAVIFLTLRAARTRSAKNSVTLAMDTLYKLWEKELRDNELDPLLARVTDQVLHLNS
ncbi:uncharacterized protein Dana_GF10850 [Drosophila ananassae]|uniref:Uncharacterized protein n=1 Tax=Drosophila ananassae TaxID=7217 RepID=B3M8V1_DROAN|nr:uncharacterized protein LOC6493717 [Drosophila ananassae]EDV41102.1 uncharacterized protein Dana_GF10850 [Drosophila ananassae]